VVLCEKEVAESKELVGKVDFVDFGRSSGVRIHA
jgi:hypothetical protein